MGRQILDNVIIRAFGERILTPRCGCSGVTVAGGATYDRRSFSDLIGSPAGAGPVTSGAAGAVTLTAGGNNTSTALSGLLQNGSGTVALTKAGTGTLTVSANNTYTGT